MKYKLANVIVTSYGFAGTSSGETLPMESISLGYTEVEWTYVILDPETGLPQGSVPAKYHPGEGRSK